MTSAPRFYFDDNGAPGPDYTCCRCSLLGHRLWRYGASSCVELHCAACTEEVDTKAVAEYAAFRHPDDRVSFTIGNYVPARPDPAMRGASDGGHWWGHSSGDWPWWLGLPMYQDADRELARVRLECDHFANRLAWSLVEKAELKPPHDDLYRQSLLRALACVDDDIAQLRANRTAIHQRLWNRG